MALTRRFGLAPPEESRLRVACINGDIRSAFQLLQPENCCCSSPFAMMIKAGSPFQKRIPELDYVYQDDHQNRIVLYLAGAQGPLPGVVLLLQWVDRFFFFRRRATCKNDLERANLLTSLFEAGVVLDLTVQNAKKQGVVYFCATTNSVEVLRAVLRLSYADGFPETKRPDIRLKDCSQKTPLQHALEAHHFECVQLLVAAGVLGQELQLSLRNNYSQRGDTPGPSVQPSIFESFVSTITDPLKRKEQKKQSLENELMIRAQLQGEEPAAEVLEGHEAVLAVLYAGIEELKKSNALDAASAVSLLSEHNYDLQCAMREGAKQASGSDRRAKILSQAVPVCIVCFEVVPKEEDVIIRMPCGHVTCDQCWKGILGARISDGDVHETVCPFPDCHCYFPLTQASSILSSDDLQRFEKLLSLRYVALSPFLKPCPKQKCSCVLRFPVSSSLLCSLPVSADCSCGHSFCWLCSADSHEPALCQQAEAWMSALDVIQTEKQSEQWVQTETVPCPRCHSPIERNGGCNHMSCTVCRQQFCYQCGQKWKGHLDHYTCQNPRTGIDKKVETALRKWTLVECIFNKFRQATAIAPYQWNLRKYLTHDLDVRHVTVVALYMTRLLRATLPDQALVKEAGEYKALHVDLGWIQRMQTVLKSSKNVLKNSYILAFNLRKNSTRKRFLASLQEKLESTSDKLMSYLTSFPGYGEIVDDDSEELEFTSNSAEFREQFLYCHTLHARQRDIDFACTVVSRRRDDIRLASRLGLIHHTKPFGQKIPSNSPSDKTPSHQ